MARKLTQRVSYELPMPDGPGGHRLGVNGLAVDTERSLLYSGGRDGAICVWDLHLNNRSQNPAVNPSSNRTLVSEPTTFRRQVQAHTHWINDILLAQSNSALVSGSSDSTVRVWRSDSEDSKIPSSIGKHTDYVKCLASPRPHNDWVASGGLDHKIHIWDLNGGGEKLKIDVLQDAIKPKGSVYALAAKGSILASGGTDNVVRVWDSNSGRLATKFVGHTDNIRSILINEDANTILTASSDQTIKVWSITAGRCLHTFTMHNASVWSLYSAHPQLSIFYSSDRSGLVVKTDSTRNPADLDQSVCVAVLRESEGIFKVIAADDYIWTAIPKSSINRWSDVDTSSVKLVTSPQQAHRHTASAASGSSEIPGTDTNRVKIPHTSILAPSNTSSNEQPEECMPVQSQPEETIEGQHGLIKHMILNDRTRALTQDTAGEVILWDLLRCVPIESFGKCHLDDTAHKLNTPKTIANWCSLHTQTGKLSVVLEPQRCFDGEMYADEAGLSDLSQFRDDQRINLGKWVLRHLFAGLVQEQERRDIEYRTSLQAKASESRRIRRSEAPNSIEIPPIAIQHEGTATSGLSAVGFHSITEPHLSATTPGMSIGVATPAPLSSSVPENSGMNPGSPLADGHPRTTVDRPSMDDYFLANPNRQSAESSGLARTPGAGEETTIPPDPSLPSPSEPEKEEKGKRGGSRFGKKFQMSFPKKLGRTSTETKPIAEENLKVEESDNSIEKEKGKVPDFSFHGVINDIRSKYEADLIMHPDKDLESRITPSPINETPTLSLPQNTAIIIQEDQPSYSVHHDIYRGTVATVGQDADELEKFAPAWLARFLLTNQVEAEIVKITFSVRPYQDLLPEAIDPNSNNNSRLSANRMLRAKKILAYVAERIDPQYSADDPDANSMKPEEYLELYCQNALIHPDMTLLTMRTHVWRTGNDMILYYKANGKREIPFPQDKSIRTVAGDTVTAGESIHDQQQQQTSGNNANVTSSVNVLDESTGPGSARNSNLGVNTEGVGASVNTAGSTPASHSRAGSSMGPLHDDSSRN